MSPDEALLQTTSDTPADIASQDDGPGNDCGEDEEKRESSLNEEVRSHQASYPNDGLSQTVNSEQGTEGLENGRGLEDTVGSDKTATGVDPVILQEGASQHCISVDMESIQNMIPSSSSEQTVLNILLSDQGPLASAIGVNGVSSSVATQTDSNTISILATSDAGIDLKGTNNVTSSVVQRNNGTKGGVVAVKSREIELGDGDQTIHQDDGAFLAAVGGDLSSQLASASGFEVTAFVADVGHGGHIIISGGTAYQNANGTISTVQDQLQEIASSDGQLISGAEQEQVSTVAGLGQFSASNVQLSSNSDSEGAQGTLHYVLHSDVTGDGEMQYVDAGLAGAKKLYQCTIDGCGKQFSTPYRLKAHGRTHTGDTFQCEEEGCHKTFITPSDLHKHLKTHTGEKPYLCEFEGCGKVYTTSHHLKVHKRSHSGEKPFICEWENCGRSFSTGYGLKSHYRTHTGERPYKCPEHDCMKAFKTSGDLQKHVRTHTGERPFKCPYEGCGRSFTTSNIRKVHLRTHTGEKPYVCEFDSCGRAFASATNYKNHSRIHTGERPYICEVPGCNKRFTEYSSLYKHNVVHTQQKPYTCEICHKNYRQTSTLAMHRRTVHGSTEEAIDETSEDAGCSEEIIDGEHATEKRHKLDFDEAAQVATALVQGLPVMVSDEAAATALQTQYAELAASQQIGESGSLPGAIAIPIQVTMNADGTIAGAQGLNITDSNGRLIPVSLSMSLAISSFTMTPLVETSHGLEIGACDVSQIYQDPQSSLGSHLVTAQVLPEELAGQEVIDNESNGEGRISKDTQDTDVASSQAVIVTSSLPHHLLAASTADPNEGVTTSITEINDVTRLSQSSSMSSADSTSGVLGQEGENESGSIEVMGSDNSILVGADHEEPDVTDRYLTKSNLSVKS